MTLSAFEQAYLKTKSSMKIAQKSLSKSPVDHLEEYLSNLEPNELYKEYINHENNVGPLATDFLEEESS